MTQIIAEEGKQELFIIREFEAPRELVFKAFSDPKVLVKFFTPFGCTMHFHFHNYKSGGNYCWYHKSYTGKTLCTFIGVIHELVPSERIIQTSEFIEMPINTQVVMEALLFEKLPNDCTKLTIHDVCFSVNGRDALLESGYVKGLDNVFKQLDVLLKKDLGIVANKDMCDGK